MADEISTIKRVEDKSGVRYTDQGPGLEEIWKRVSRMGLVAMTLQGHKNVLFKTHLSFKQAQEKLEAPLRSPSQPLKDIVTMNFDTLNKRFKNQLSSALEAMFHFKFSADDTSEEGKVDKPYLTSVLTTFVRYPTVSYCEVHLQDKGGIGQEKHNTLGTFVRKTNVFDTAHTRIRDSTESIMCHTNSQVTLFRITRRGRSRNSLSRTE